MGAATFYQKARGKTAQEAFSQAVRDAKHAYGHAGYTGTIAEKGSFVMIKAPAGVKAYAYAQQLVDDGDPRVDDQWGPAGCIELAPGEYLFFGWASE